MKILFCLEPTINLSMMGSSEKTFHRSVTNEVNRHLEVFMFNKVSYLFCTAVAMFLLGLAAYLDNGTMMPEQPGLAWMMVAGLACAFAGGILLRQNTQWVGMSLGSCITALLTAIAINPDLHPPFNQAWLWILPLGSYVGLAAYLFWPKPRQKKPDLKLVA